MASGAALPIVGQNLSGSTGERGNLGLKESAGSTMVGVSCKICHQLWNVSWSGSLGTQGHIWTPFSGCTLVPHEVPSPVQVLAPQVT